MIGTSIDAIGDLRRYWLLLRPLRHGQHEDKDYSAVDCLSFVVMLKLGIQEAWTFDDHFSHRFVARPGPGPG
jgi:hypothetical protein